MRALQRQTDGLDRVGTGAEQQANGFVDVGGRPQGRGRSQVDDQVRPIALAGVEKVQHVHEDGPVLAGIGGQVGWTKKRHVRARGTRRVGNFGIVGGAHDTINQSCCAASLHGMGDQRLASEQLEILAWDPLGPAPRGHDDKHAQCVTRAHGPRILGARLAA